MVNDNAPLSDIQFVAFDLETTGLLPDSCRIVEFGAVRFGLDGGELGHFEQLVDPECPIPRAVIRIHGITDKMVHGKPTVAAVLPEFLNFLAGPDTMLLAHNARFDLGFVSFALAGAGLAVPSSPVIDTLDLARACVPGLSRHRLIDLAIRLRVARREDHRALSDSRLVMGVFRGIVDRTRGLQTAGDLTGLSRPLAFWRSDLQPHGPPATHQDLAAAIRENRTVVVVYDRGTQGVSTARITPRSLLHAVRYPYLIAYCHTDGMEKTFRLDRIRELRLDDR